MNNVRATPKYTTPSKYMVSRARLLYPSWEQTSTNRNLKADFDGDGFIGVDDLKRTLIALTKNRLTQDEVDIVCSKVLDEADHDNDGQISFLEFKHVVSRSPDFMR